MRELFGGGATLEVVPDKGGYLPGETAHVWVRVRASEDLAIDEGRLELRYAQRYSYKERRRDSRGRSHTRTVTATDEQVVAAARFLDAGMVLADSLFDSSAALPLPAGAPPSGAASITAIAWTVRAVLNRPRALDVIGEVSIAVLSPAGSVLNWAARPPESDALDGCEMRMRLSSYDARGGDRLRGDLWLLPREDFGARGVRVELVRREVVRPPETFAGRADEHHAETGAARGTLVEDIDLRAGAALEYPFEIVVPEGSCPSLETPLATVGWAVKAVVDRPFRGDCRLAQPIHVSTAPPPRLRSERI